MIVRVGLGASHALRKPLPYAPRGSAGGSVDSLFIVYHEATNTVWLHGTPIEMGDDNVLLVDNSDPVGTKPVIAGRLAVPATFSAPRRSGPDPGSPGRALKAYLLEDPRIRSFVERGFPPG